MKKKERENRHLPPFPSRGLFTSTGNQPGLLGVRKSWVLSEGLKAGVVMWEESSKVTSMFITTVARIVSLSQQRDGKEPGFLV